MAYARIVTNKNGTIVRNVKMDGSTIAAVDAAATALESVIWDERKILHVEVDYALCDDSKTVEGYTP